MKLTTKTTNLAVAAGRAEPAAEVADLQARWPHRVEELEEMLRAGKSVESVDIFARIFWCSSGAVIRAYGDDQLYGR